jgi:Holliday junction resolvase
VTNSRNKGRSGEQEIARTLRDELGLEVTRNWQQQAAQGGVDIIGVPGWAIEVKRAKQWSHEWWTQTAAQAARTGDDPVLLYRLDYKTWRCQSFTSYVYWGRTTEPPKLKNENRTR